MPPPSPRRCAPTASSTPSPIASSVATSCASRCSRPSSPTTSPHSPTPSTTSPRRFGRRSEATERDREPESRDHRRHHHPGLSPQAPIDRRTEVRHVGVQLSAQRVDLQIENLSGDQIAPATGRAVHEDRRLLHTERVFKLTSQSYPGFFDRHLASFEVWEPR